MTAPAPRMLAFGAHPDDCEVQCAGLARKLAQAGGEGLFVSLTNGDAGHFREGGAPLAQRRQAEARAAAEVLGIRSLVLDNHDGELTPSLEIRRAVIRLIRAFRPDLVLTHRLMDYHPDHRATAQLVQDAAYMVTVPNVCPQTPHLAHNPIIAYFYDAFRQPTPFRADVVVAIDEVLADKLAALHCHASQFYEWLPYNEGHLEAVPREDSDRLAWLRETRGAYDAALAERYRTELIARYGPEVGAGIRFAEAYEISEYGAPLEQEAGERLFPR
ncbi:MAG: PIG-L deacetylase family protein [Anaerolineae bacterium]